MKLTPDSYLCMEDTQTNLRGYSDQTFYTKIILCKRYYRLTSPVTIYKILTLFIYLCIQWNGVFKGKIDVTLALKKDNSLANTSMLYLHKCYCIWQTNLKMRNSINRIQYCVFCSKKVIFKFDVAVMAEVPHLPYFLKGVAFMCSPYIFSANEQVVADAGHPMGPWYTFKCTKLLGKS